MGKEQLMDIEVHGQKFPFSAVTTIEDRRMFAAINCPGVQDIFGAEAIGLPVAGHYEEVNPQTGGVEWVRNKQIKDKHGRHYKLKFAFDLDNRSVTIERETDGGWLTIARLNVRDRAHDGTRESTPPNFLNTPDVPERSKYVGGTLWRYSNPDVDRQLPGRSSVEMSRVSSDPAKIILDELISTEGIEGARILARFINNPFAALPFDDPSSVKLTQWYKLWWKVLNQGLLGERIAYPGQVAEQGFKGFSPYVLKSLSEILGEHNYTHISSVPTWLYVWRMNINGSGFSPDNAIQHKEALDFLERLGGVKLPVLEDSQSGKVVCVRDLFEKNPTISWLALAPFALQLDSSIQPQLNIEKKEQDLFGNVLSSIKQNLIDPNGVVATYPLAPDRNLWHSKEV